MLASVVTGCGKSETSEAVGEVPCGEDGTCSDGFVCKAEVCAKVKSAAELQYQMQEFERLDRKTRQAQEEFNAAQGALALAVEDANGAGLALTARYFKRVVSHTANVVTSIVMPLALRPALLKRRSQRPQASFTWPKIRSTSSHFAISPGVASM